MKLKTVLAAAFLTALPVAAVSAWKQDEAPPPAPELEALKPMAGTWDAEMRMGEGGDVERGQQTVKMGLNGMWMVADFEGSMMGGPFLGHDVLGWDAQKKKYVGCWVDSMTPALTLYEGGYDAATKTFTFETLTPDLMTGMKSVMITRIVDANTHVWEMHPGSADAPAMMSITYKRRK